MKCRRNSTVPARVNAAKATAKMASGSLWLDIGCSSAVAARWRPLWLCGGGGGLGLGFGGGDFGGLGFGGGLGGGGRGLGGGGLGLGFGGGGRGGGGGLGRGGGGGLGLGGGDGLGLGGGGLGFGGGGLGLGGGGGLGLGGGGGRGLGGGGGGLTTSESSKRAFCCSKSFCTRSDAMSADCDVSRAKIAVWLVSSDAIRLA